MTRLGVIVALGAKLGHVRRSSDSFPGSRWPGPQMVVAAGTAVVLLGPAVGAASAAGGPAARTRLAAGRDGSGGTWGTAREVPGTATLGQGGSAAVGSVSCASGGNCSAGGHSFGGSGHPLAAMLPALTFAAPAQAQAKQYPYRLVDPGTFGGPGSFLTLPGSITSNGTVMGTADTITPDPDLPVSNCAPFCDGYVQHAFAWRRGRLVDLGALAPAAHNNSAIYQLNGNGVGTGESENGRIDPLTGSPSIEATVFERGRVVGLGTLGGHESGGGDINSHGQVTGFSTTSTRDPFPSEQQYYLPFVGEIRGFVWRDGVMRDLGTLGGPDAFSVFQNQRGQIAGWSDTNSRLHAATGAPTIDPFLWQDGRMIDLGGLGGTIGQVGWLNDKGEVVGMSDLAGDRNAHPFLWRNGKMIDLGTPNGDFGAASYINQRGDSTGAYFASDGNFHGVLWHHGKMVDLPPVGGAAQAFGNAINDRDQVVGNQDDSNFNEVSAALWTGGHGYDLNTLVAPSDFQMISADYINNQGEIFGHGLYTSGPNAGNARVFVLIRNSTVPLPADSTAGRLLPRTHPANLSALALSARVGPGRGAAMSAAIRRILLLTQDQDQTGTERAVRCTATRECSSMNRNS